MLTLAMTRHQQPSTLRAVRDVVSQASVTPPAAGRKEPRAEAIGLFASNSSMSHAKVQLAKRTKPDEGNPLILTQKNLRSGRMWASVEAGWGDVFDDKPVEIYGRNGTGWEEPSVGYLKLSLSF